MNPAVPPRVVPPAKLIDYLLNVDHPVGALKAAFFRAFGFGLDGLDVMAKAQADHPDRNPTAAVGTNAHG